MIEPKPEIWVLVPQP